MGFPAVRRGRLNALLAIAIVVSCLGLIFFTYSRPERNGFGYEHDFVNVVSGAHCVVDRCDPYDSPTLEREFKKMGGYPPVSHFLPEWPVYPPSTLIVLWPLSLLRWPLLSVAWMLLCFGFLSAACIVLILKFEAYRDLLSFLPFAILLTDKSIGWAVQLGQPIFVAASSLTLAIVMLESQSLPVLATAFLALSLCLKPQAAFLCGIYFLFHKQTRTQAISAYLFTGAAAIAGTLIFYFRLGSFAYLRHLAANLRLTFQPGRDSDASTLNSASASFLNLQALAGRFIHNPHICNDITYAVVFALAALLAFSCYRNGNFATRPYTILAVLVMLELLLSYHRHYDQLLILAAFPAMYEIERRSTAAYLVFVGSLCAYHFGELHGAWTHPWGPLPFGPIVEIFIVLFCIGTLWSGPAAGTSSFPVQDASSAA